MDFKKIKPNDLLGYLDELVAKIPESISSLLTKIMIAILALSMMYAAYYGYLQGFGSATQEGQELAKDTKSLFLEDMEREYNRKRKNIRMPSADSLISDEIYRTPKQYESSGRANESGSIVNQSDSIMENDKSIRSYKKTGNTSPFAELETSEPDSVPIPRNENRDPEQRQRRKLHLKDSFDSPIGNDSRELESVLDKVHSDPKFENKILDRKDSKKKKYSNGEPSNLPEPNNLQKDTGKLPKSEKSQKKDRGLIPLDGNE